MKSAMKEIPLKIQELIQSHEKDLETAWANCADSEALNISFSAKVGFKDSKPICEVSILFTVEKVKDSKIFYWEDKQMNLKYETQGKEAGHA